MKGALSAALGLRRPTARRLATGWRLEARKIKSSGSKAQENVWEKWTFRALAGS